jgi:replicative DNA helicase
MNGRLIIPSDTQALEEHLTREERRVRAMNQPSLIMPSTKEPDIEEALLSGLIHSEEEFSQCGELRGEEFENPWLGKIYDMLKLRWKAEEPSRDPTILFDELKKRDDFPDGYRTAAFVAQLIHAGLVANVNWYANQIRARAQRRNFIRMFAIALERAKEVRDPDEKIMKWVNAAYSRLGSTADVTRPIGDVARQVIDELSQPPDTQAATRVVLPGLVSVGQRTGAFHPGELLVLSGYTGGGKTSFALQMAYDAASRGQQVLVLSMEMRDSELAKRLVAQQAGVDGRLLRNRIWEEEDLDRMRKVADEMAPYPLHLCERGKSDWDVDRVEAVARLHSSRDGLELLVIDYLTLLDLRDPGNAKQPLREQIDEAVRRLKTLAQELECVILLLVQLSREGQKQTEPELVHLADSAAIERHADCVMLIYHDQLEPTVAHLKIAKNRNGPTGKMRLGWDPKLTQFSDV